MKLRKVSFHWDLDQILKLEKSASNVKLCDFDRVLFISGKAMNLKTEMSDENEAVKCKLSAIKDHGNYLKSPSNVRRKRGRKLSAVKDHGNYVKSPSNVRRKRGRTLSAVKDHGIRHQMSGENEAISFLLSKTMEIT